MAGSIRVDAGERLEELGRWLGTSQRSSRTWIMALTHGLASGAICRRETGASAGTAE